MSSSGQDVDYFAVLEVSRNCSDDEVKQAYRKLARRWHPDKNPGNKAEAEKKFKLISEAYQVLSEKSQRESYIKYGRNVFSGTASSYQFHSASELFKEFFADDPFLADLLEDLDSRSHKRAQRRKPSDYTFSSSRSDATGADSYFNQSADDLFRAHFGDNPLYKEFFGDAASTGKATKTEGPDTSKSNLGQQNENLIKEAGPESKPKEKDTSFPATHAANHDDAKFTQKSTSEDSQASNVWTSATERKRNGDINGPQTDAQNDKSRKSQAGDDEARAAEAKRCKDEQNIQRKAEPDSPEKSRASSSTASAAEAKRTNVPRDASTAESTRTSDADGRQKDTVNESRSGKAKARQNESQDGMTSPSLPSAQDSTFLASSCDKRSDTYKPHLEPQNQKHGKDLRAKPEPKKKDDDSLWKTLKGIFGYTETSEDQSQCDPGSSSSPSAPEVQSQTTVCYWCPDNSRPAAADLCCYKCQMNMCRQCVKEHVKHTKHEDIRLIT